MEERGRKGALPRLALSGVDIPAQAPCKPGSWRIAFHTALVRWALKSALDFTTKSRPSHLLPTPQAPGPHLSLGLLSAWLPAALGLFARRPSPCTAPEPDLQQKPPAHTLAPSS